MMKLPTCHCLGQQKIKSTASKQQGNLVLFLNQRGKAFMCRPNANTVQIQKKLALAITCYHTTIKRDSQVSFPSVK